MNAKKAKMLRREVKLAASTAQDYVKPNGLVPTSSYNVPYFNRITNKESYRTVNHPTKVNTPFSLRGEYRQLKKEMRSFT